MRKFSYPIITYTLSLFLLFSNLSCSKDDVNVEETPENHDYGTIDDLMSKSQGPTVSTKTAMGIHFENLKKTTADDIKWLSDPAREPSIPPNQTSNLVLSPFDVELYPFINPSPADCNQRALGDCSAIAIFAEIAYTNPDYVKSLITDNHNGSYSVKMFDPDAQQIEVRVSNKFLSYRNTGKLAGVNGKNSQATWATILEKALMKYNDIYKLVSNIEGIGSEYASPTLTGNGSSFAFYSRKLTPEELKRAVEVSLAEGKIVIGGFDKADVEVGPSKTVSGHAWSFSYAPKTKKNGYTPIFVMRNPWGHNNGTDLDGQMYIPENDDITKMIDLRIIDAGRAKPSKIPGIYHTPVED